MYVNAMPATELPAAGVKSADRVLTMFELLGSWAREMSHAEIAAAMGIPKSSLTQLLKNLVGRGWLSYRPTTKGYSIGPAFALIARKARQSADLAAVAGPALAALTEQTSESSALNVLKGDFAEVAGTVLGPQRLVSHMRPGDVAPLYATSGGKVILAFLPADQQDEYLGRAAFAATTPATIRSARQLRAQLRDIRASGLAFSFDEWTPGITGMARAVLSANGDVLASVNVAMPSVRYNEGAKLRVDEALQRAVEAIGQQLARA